MSGDNPPLSRLRCRLRVPVQCPKDTGTSRAAFRERFQSEVIYADLSAALRTSPNPAQAPLKYRSRSADSPRRPLNSCGPTFMRKFSQCRVCLLLQTLACTYRDMASIHLAHVLMLPACRGPLLIWGESQLCMTCGRLPTSVVATIKGSLMHGPLAVHSLLHFGKGPRLVDAWPYQKVPVTPGSFVKKGACRGVSTASP